ncbi:MAG: VWA domain-containing protein [Verrucomicrobiales bacterium]
MITFDAPEWFILLPALAFLAWRWPGLGVARPLRAAALVMAVILLADPRLPSRSGGLDLWVLLDRSASTEDAVDRDLPEWRRLLMQAKPGRRDELHFLDFAADVIPAPPDGGTSLYSSRRGATRTAQAISHVLARQDKDRPARVLVMTDGFATEPLGEAATKLQAEGIPLDFRRFGQIADGDTRLSRFEAPARAQPGEAFVLRVTVTGDGDAVVPVRFTRNGQPAGEASVQLKAGRGSLEMVDRIDSGGSHVYEATLLVPNDPHPANNVAKARVQIEGGPRVLLLTRFPDDPMAEVFRGQGLEVELVTETKELDAGRLTGARAVVFNDVPAFDVPRPFLDALDFHVREQGAGLLMAGGKHSFGSGGYFQSPVDPLLPVSMELKSEHRKLAVAMAIVLDRSGSMGATVPGPGGKVLTKMDLANTGAASTIELLGVMDEVCVFAVDTSAHEIVRMAKVAEKRGEMIAKTRSIQTGGGGIYVYEGLSTAWKELKRSTAGTRHLILFSDAADSEEPGEYKELIKDMRAGGATISVIGMGTDKDVDAALLKDIAKLGGGRIQFTEKAEQIPQLFAMETVTVARSAFITESTPAKVTGNWAEVSGQSLDWLPAVDGYNLSYARDGAAVSLATGDEYSAPLVATLRRGLGRTAAVSFPLAGDQSAASRAWPGYSDFLKTLARWLVGPAMPPGLGLSHRIEGNRLSVRLSYANDDWARRLAKEPPILKLAIESEMTTVRDVPWQRISPGEFTASLELQENEVVRGAIQAGGHTAGFGPLALGVSAEWAFEPERLEELQAVSRTTGGRELIDLAQAWLKPEVGQRVDLRLPLCIAVMLLLLLDAWQTRWQWTWKKRAVAEGGFDPANLPKAARKAKPVKVKPAPVEPPKESAAAEEEAEAARRRSRFAKAKSGK